MASTFLSKTLGTPTSSRIWTFSTWIKRSGISSGQHIFSIDNGTDRDAFSFDSDDGLRLYFNSSASPYADLSTNRLLRDTSSFYHLVLTVDTTQATADDRVKLYINGTQYTWDETTIDPSQNYDTFNASGNTFRIGRDRTTTAYLDAILAHTHFIDGTAYDASTFGESDSTSGIWKPKTAPSVTYGNNGFFLKMENSGAMGTDSSGNSNNFTVSGTLTQNVDTPDNVFSCINGIAQGTYNLTLTTGNNTVYCTDNAWRSAFSTFALSSGKYYFEVKRVGSSANMSVGIVDQSQLSGTVGTDKLQTQTRGYAYLASGQKGNSGSESSWGNAYAQNDIVGCALDFDNGKIYFSQNGVWENSGNPESGSTGTGSMYNLTSGYDYLIGASLYSTSAGASFNFGNGYYGTTAVSSAGTNASGNGIFEYNVPAGYTALSIKGLNL
jgi:hypothetical protein